MYDTGWTYVWQSVCCWSFIIWNVHVSVWKFIERIYKHTYCAYITYYIFSQRIHFYTYIYTPIPRIPCRYLPHERSSCLAVQQLWNWVLKQVLQAPGGLLAFQRSCLKKRNLPGPSKHNKRKHPSWPSFFLGVLLEKNKKVLWSLVACIKHCEMMSRRLRCWNCTNAFPFPRWGNPNYAPMIPAKNQKVHCYNHSVASGLREQDANWLNHLANSMQISVIPCGVKQQSRAIQRPSHVATTSLGNPFEKVKGSLRSNKAPAKCRIPDRQEGWYNFCWYIESILAYLCIVYYITWYINAPLHNICVHAFLFQVRHGSCCHSC